jgi:hypothetical protein
VQARGRQRERVDVVFDGAMLLAKTLVEQARRTSASRSNSTLILALPACSRPSGAPARAVLDARRRCVILGGGDHGYGTTAVARVALG